MHRAALSLATLCAVWCCASAVVSVVQLSLENSQLDPVKDRSTSNVAYYGPITVGGSNFTACFDTGSSDLWLPSSECTSEVCQTKVRFNAATASNTEVSNQEFEITYGSGAVAGVIAESSLSLGTPNIAISKQVFGDALQLTTDFIATSCDGLFGLAFPELSSLEADGPFFNMIDEGLLDATQFTISLNANTSAVDAGQLIFGGNDSSLYTGELRSYPVLSPSYWVITLNGSAVSSTNGTVSVPLEATAAIIDLGTTGIVLSDADAGNISAQIPRLEYWAEMDVWNLTGNCSDLSDLPSVDFIIGSDTYSVPPSQWVTEISDDIDPSPEACISSILPGGATNAAVLGTTFMRTFYSSFTVDGTTGATVSLATSASSVSVGTTANTTSTSTFESQSPSSS